MAWTWRTSGDEIRSFGKDGDHPGHGRIRAFRAQTLKELGVHRSTFYNWYRRYLEDGVEGLGPQQPKARTFWNKIPEKVKDQVVQEALEQTELSPRELACRITDIQEYFISESSVYRILKSHDLITRPAYILLQASDFF